MEKNEVMKTGVAVVMGDNTEQIDDVAKETVEMEEEETEEMNVAETKELVINSYVIVVHADEKSMSRILAYEPGRSRMTFNMASSSVFRSVRKLQWVK